MKQQSLLLAVLALFVAATGPRAAEGPRDQETIEVYASIAPIAGLIERLASDRVAVRTLLPENADPHTFEPNVRTVVGLSRAAAFFSAGLPLEKRIVERMDRGPDTVRIVSLENEKEADNPHAHDGHGHDHATDPHIWLSPPDLKRMVQSIARALARLDRGNEALYRERVDTLVQEIDAAEKRTAERLASLKGRAFYVYHPALGHFAEHFDLQQIALEQNGAPPSARQVVEFSRRAREEGIRALLVQPQHNTPAVRGLADSMGARIIIIDPLAPDPVANLGNLADAIIEAVDTDGETR